MLSLGLVFYAGWHFTKAAFFRPESPFDWTLAEREILFAMPLRPRDLVAYQLASVTATTLFKAALFTLLLLPDLRSVPLGFVGLLLAMLMLEILRLTIDIATWGMGRSAYAAYRATITAGLAAVVFAIGAELVRAGTFHGRIDVDDGLLQRIVDILVQMNHSVFSYAALPFQPFVDLVLADGMTASNMGLVAATSAVVTGLAFAVIGLFVAANRRAAQREKRDYRAIGAVRNLYGGSTQSPSGMIAIAGWPLRLKRIPRWAAPARWRGGNSSAPAVIGAAC